MTGDTALKLVVSVLLAVVVVLVVAVRIGNASGTLATRLPMTRRVATGVSMAVSAVLGLLGTTIIVIVFGAVTNADAGSKATRLAKGLSEALNCTPVALLLFAGVITTVLFVARRRRRRPPDADSNV